MIFLNLTTYTTFTLFVMTVLSQPAEAYVHLVYGSLITQVALSGFLGLLLSGRKLLFHSLLTGLGHINPFSKLKRIH